MTRSFEQLKDQLGRGVGPLLPDVPTGEFEQVIEQMALLQYRHDLQRSGDQSVLSQSSDAGDCELNVAATSLPYQSLPGS